MTTWVVLWMYWSAIKHGQCKVDHVRKRSEIQRNKNNQVNSLYRNLRNRKFIKPVITVIRSLLCYKHIQIKIKQISYLSGYLNVPFFLKETFSWFSKESLSTNIATIMTFRKNWYSNPLGRRNPIKVINLSGSPKLIVHEIRQVGSYCYLSKWKLNKR